MPRTRPPYPPAFRAEAERLIRSGQKPLTEIAKDMGVSDQTLRNWVRQVGVDEGSREGLTSSEKEELRRLRRENRVLREEREILRKAPMAGTATPAAAFFAARETGSSR
jgi:transposase